MRRVASASCVETGIAFYDFYIYGTAAVAFIARPVGAVSFGHYGDRIGRKRTLIATVLLMGVPTVLIGRLPGAATIGVAGLHLIGPVTVRLGIRSGWRMD